MTGAIDLWQYRSFVRGMECVAVAMAEGSGAEEEEQSAVWRFGVGALGWTGDRDISRPCMATTQMALTRNGKAGECFSSELGRIHG